jgi:DNA-binding MarR family transcriptional regulator
VVVDEPPDLVTTKPFRGVAFTLSSLGYAVSQGFARTLAPVGLHPREFAVLRAVAAEEGQSQQALADSLHIPRSRMVAIVDELEARELVERRPHPEDRRVRELHLTKVGRRVAKDAFKRAVDFEREVSAALSLDEHTSLLDLLDRVSTSLGIGPGAHAALREPAGEEEPAVS